MTGGLGYIGSHTITELIASGLEVVSLDNEINSSLHALEGIYKITGSRVENIHVDLSDMEATLAAVREYLPFDGIIHFAALKSVEESVFKAGLYIQNNVGGALSVMRMMEEFDIRYLIFSSSCTVYGTPDVLPVTENTPFAKAENPYGASKQACEILFDQFFSSEKVHQKACISLRYFNPAGAHPSYLIGESPLNKATNLVPVITETAFGKRDALIVFGDDYPTRDGSCVRDYIHVMDLARAHTLALKYLLGKKNATPFEAFNLGIGAGITVFEAIHAFEKATGVKVKYRVGPRRAGDVASIYADNSKITSLLGWEPQYSIDDMMTSAWEWEKHGKSGIT